MGVVPAQIQDQEKPKRRSMSWILIQTSPWKARNSNLVEVRVQYIIWSHLRKKDSITGVCWEKWHRQRTDAWRISHIQEASHLNATSKSQASNKQDSLSLLSTNLVRQQSHLQLLQLSQRLASCLIWMIKCIQTWVLKIRSSQPIS
jgi:hypothetical protein